jgi:Putative beta-barrel porin-2, OmpL-like. bbp2
MDKLVMRWGLGAMLALAALPMRASAQTPPPAMSPMEPAPVAPAPPIEPAPPAAVVEPPPPMMAPPVADAPPAEVVAVVTEAPPAAPAAIPPTITGYVETSYHISFTNPNTNQAVPTRVYDPAGNSFALHAAHLAISHKFTDAISAVIEIDAGRDAAATGALQLYPWRTETQFAFDIQEAYANYASGAWTLTAGKFVTYEGIEVIEGPLNPTITRGFLFGYAEPFTHTGVKLHFQPVDAFNIGVGVVNGWDLIGDNNPTKTVIARIAVTPSTKFFAALSGSIGGEQADTSKHPRASIDLTGALTPSEHFQLWFQGNFGAEKIPDAMGGPITKATWWGVGLQPVLTEGAFTLGGRLEYFADPKGVRMALAPHAKYFNITVTPGVKLADAFKLRAEFRADIANDKVLGKPSDPKKMQYTGALSAEYSF